MEWLVAPEEDALCVRDFIRRRLPLSGRMLKYLKYREDGIRVNGLTPGGTATEMIDAW